MAMGRALHAYGTPAHRLEAALRGLSRASGLTSELFVLPTMIQASFDAPGFHSQHMLRVEPGEVDLEKLGLLDAVASRAMRHTESPAGALADVKAIVAAPPRFGTVPTVLAYGMASAGAAHFFAGGWVEIGVSLLLGLAIGSLYAVAGRQRALAQVADPVAAALAAAVAQVAAHLLPPVSAFVVTMAGLVVLIPGLTLTVAINELATRNLVAGTARLAGAMVTFAQIGFGLLLGSQLDLLLPMVDHHVHPIPLSAWTDPAAIVVASIGFGVLFRANPRDLPRIVGIGAVAYFASRWGGELLGPQLGVAAAAFVVAALSNLFSRRADRPATILLVPGIMLLVPGSLGVRSVAALLQKDTASGIEQAFTALMVALALVAGILIANAVVPSRKAL
jgi:uncharacterized membrane protein YjjP (DUF1212 family)